MSGRGLLRFVQALAFVAIASLPGLAAGDERIHTFDAVIDIARDGTLSVVEAIEVTAEGDRIKRGIYRDFPTHYRGRYGERVVVPFEVVRVLRDGRNEAHHVERVDGGERLYIGRSDGRLDPGRHRFEIHYRTRRQLGFFDDHDELYWNVTGNFWDFPIDRASALVRLPEAPAADETASEGFTGPVGSKARNLSAGFDSEAKAFRYETTAGLERHEGLTIVAQFPKGLVEEPTENERSQAFLLANRPLIVAATGLAVVLAYYLASWFAFGRDPATGTIIPRFEPPARLSPAAMRHLVRMGYDPVCFAVAIIDMAIKGFLEIREADGVFTIVRASGDRALLSAGEKQLADRLLADESFTFRQTDHTRIRSAIAVFEKRLKAENEGGRFRTNRGWFIPGLALSALAIIATAVSVEGGTSSQPGAIPVAFLMLWLTIWSLGVVALVRKVVDAWRSAGAPSVQGRTSAKFAATLLTCFALPFVIAEVAVLSLLAVATSPLTVAVLVLLVISNFCFYQLLKQPTLAGRHLMDEIQGFELYLATAEIDDIRRLEGPKPTPELFERYLPYALALGVENAWAERFSELLEQAGTSAADDYRPNWYSGENFRDVGAHSFASTLGASLSSAVASTSSAPGSSSGGGGGGSSGGGGGGGGGGGW